MLKSKPRAHQCTQTLVHWTETAGMTSSPLCLLLISVFTARRAEQHRGWFWNNYSMFVSMSKTIQPSSGAILHRSGCRQQWYRACILYGAASRTSGRTAWNCHISSCSGSIQLCPGDDTCTQVELKKKKGSPVKFKYSGAGHWEEKQY